MKESISVLGYHKTTRRHAEETINNRSFKVSTGREMWLGNGIYFWDTLENAIWWNNKRYTDGTILTAQLKCKAEQFVDLDDPINMRRIVEFAESIKTEIEQSGKYDIDFQNKTQARALFCTLFKKKYSIMLMKHSFSWLTDNAAGFRDLHSRTQYCATNNTIISNIRIMDGINAEMIGDNNEYV